jgi:hypothetical protein
MSDARLPTMDTKHPTSSSGSPDSESGGTVRSDQRTQNTHFVFLLLGIVIFAAALAAFQMGLLPQGNVRVVLGVICGIVSMVLIILGGGWRSRAVQTVGLVACLVLVCAPIFRQDSLLSESSQDLGSTPEVNNDEEKVATSHTRVGEYNDQDLNPLFAALAKWDGESGLLGVWVHGRGGADASIVSQYLGRLAQTNQTPKVYGGSTSERGCLILVQGSPLAYNELVQVVRRIGDVEFENADNHFVDVTLNSELFAPVSNAPGMIDPQNELFVENNMRELANPDVRRVLSAARRLSSPNLLISDEQRGKIVELLMDRLKEPWGNNPEYPAVLAEALVQMKPSQSGDARQMLVYIAKWLSNSPQYIPQTLIDYLLKQVDTASASVVIELWKTNPSQWESQCMKLGSLVEKDIIQQILEGKCSGTKLESSMRILGKCGTINSLPILRELGQLPEQRMALLAQLAIDEITARQDEKAEN